MKLYEFVADDHDALMLTGIISQILSRIVDTGFKKEYSLTSLLNTLSKKGYTIDREEFIEMISNPPLKNLIANIKGDNIIFKGEVDQQDDSESLDTDETSDTLEKMAKRAAKK